MKIRTLPGGRGERGGGGGGGEIVPPPAQACNVIIYLCTENLIQMHD